MQSNFFYLKKSHIYFYYLVFTHLFSLTCVFIVSPVFFDNIFLLLLIISFLYYLLHDQKIMSLRHNQKTEWILGLPNGEMRYVTLLPSSVMMRYFLVLHFKCIHSDRKERMVLFTDHFSKEDYRALRRCMKMGYL